MMTGNVVEEFQIGDTKFKICDDFCREVTAVDTEEILKNLAREVYPALLGRGEFSA